MRWGAHIAIGAGIGAAIDPLAIPAAVLGSTAPDWLEYLSKLFGHPVKHRTVTHVCAYWIAGVVFAVAANLGPLDAHVLGFALGGLSHVLGDACTVSGVPFWPWSTRRFHLFGGRLRSGQPGEMLLAAAVLACGVGWATLTHSARSGGYIPFLPDYPAKYQSGVIDAAEWRAHRFDIL